MLTSKQAAAMLGVSERRVRALVEDGALKAQRLGRSWAIDEASVARRASSPRFTGRPPGGVRDADSLERYTLMNNTHEVASFVYDRVAHQVKTIEPLADEPYAPPGACGINGHVNLINFNGWLADRYIPRTRSGLANLLCASGLDNPADLMFSSLGLNLSDQYWFRPEGISVDWHQINYFENPYHDRAKNTYGPASLALWGPSTATDGQLDKWWERRGESHVLIKGSGPWCHEPYAEQLATQLYQRLLAREDFVPYTLEVIGEEKVPYSVCPDFITPQTELVTLRDLELRFGTGYPKERYDNYASLLERLGIDNPRTKLAKMIVCDFLTANSDRHDRNLGVVRNAETLEWLDIAPIYDNGRAFYYGARNGGELEHGMFFYASNPFSEYPSKQLTLAEDYSWFSLDALEGFPAQIEETLSHNSLLPEGFAHGAACQFERRLERVVESAQEHGWRG